MVVGLPSEVKTDENRVALLPVGVEALLESGHEVFEETNAGHASGLPDEDYIAAGARIVEGPE